MKRILSLVLVLMLCLPLVSAMAEEEKVLNIFTWEYYIDDETLANFTAETGIEINYATFASNEEMLMKLQANGATEYDIILASDYILSMAHKEGLLLPLDREKLTGWDNLNPYYLNQYFDLENVYTMPYAAGVPGIIYDPSRVSFEITSFADLWNEEFTDNLCLLDDARVMIGAVLKTLGYSYNTTDEAQLAEAKAKLMELRKNVRVLDYDTAYMHVLSGEVLAAYVFTPYAVIAEMENPDIKCVFPKEGIGFGIDSLAIPANAPHPENAHLLLDFLLRPEVAAHVAECQWYANPNLAAEELISDEFKAYAALNVPEELLATKEFVQDVGEFESVFQDMWLEFKLQ